MLCIFTWDIFKFCLHGNNKLHFLNMGYFIYFSDAHLHVYNKWVTWIIQTVGLKSRYHLLLCVTVVDSGAKQLRSQPEPRSGVIQRPDNIGIRINSEVQGDFISDKHPSPTPNCLFICSVIVFPSFFPALQFPSVPSYFPLQRRPAVWTDWCHTDHAIHLKYRCPLFYLFIYLFSFYDGEAHVPI